MVDGLQFYAHTLFVNFDLEMECVEKIITFFFFFWGC